MCSFKFGADPKFGFIKVAHTIYFDPTMSLSTFRKGHPPSHDEIQKVLDDNPQLILAIQDSGFRIQDYELNGDFRKLCDTRDYFIETSSTSSVWLTKTRVRTLNDCSR